METTEKFHPIGGEIQMERLHRRKICQSPLGRIYYVYIETDPELGLHTVRIYDEDPEIEPTEIRFLGLKIKIDPPPAKPIIERTYPAHYNVQQKIEEMIWRHELPEIQLRRLDEWDGVVRYRPPEQIQTEPAPPVEPQQEETRNHQPDTVIPIKHWAEPGVTYYYNVATNRLRKAYDMEESG